MRKLNLSLIFLLYFASKAIFAAEVIPPLQIFFPGNFNGKTVELTDDLKFLPSGAHKIPALIETSETEQKNTLIFAAGNNSSIFEPLSFILNGRIENEIIRKCRPNALAASPSDLETADLKNSKEHIKNLLFTNAVSKNFPQPFKLFEAANISGKNLYFFNFISAELCKNLPINNWENFEADDFQRTLRRLKIDFKDSDITISTVYASENETENLAQALKNRKGIHFLVNMSSEKQIPFYPVTNPQIDGNVFKFSLKDGNANLPVLNIIFKNIGSPRITLRMLPLDKFICDPDKNSFTEIEERTKQIIFKPLRIVTTSEKASTAANFIETGSHAALIKKALNTDMVMMIKPNQKHINSNVINLGAILKTMENDRIFLTKFSGETLSELIKKLIAGYGKNRLTFEGCEFKYFAGKIHDFKISGRNINPKKMYLIATTQKTLNDSIAEKLFAKESIQSFDGLFLWDIWKNNLRFDTYID